MYVHVPATTFYAARFCRCLPLAAPTFSRIRRFYFPIVRFSRQRERDTTRRNRETRTHLWPLDDVTTQQQRRRRDLFGRAPNRPAVNALYLN